MNIWFLVLVLIGVMNIGYSLSKHGEERDDYHSFWITLFGVITQLYIIHKAIEVGFQW